ncbi:MAG: SlyX family protein [Pseudomonadota bacterium]
MEKLEQIETSLTHLHRTVEELSDVIARQDKEIQALSQRVEFLMQREAAREQEGGAVVFGDEPPPPHY